MRIVIAPDKFKGSITAVEVCNAIEKGILEYDSSIEVVNHPLADGGEGTLDILQNHFELKQIKLKVNNPLFQEIEASYMVSIDTAFIEMANASGLQLLEKNDQNCYYTTTYGTGQLILHAILKGYKKIVLFIGGSATNDGGIGMANALGYRFYDKNQNILQPIGKELINIASIDTENVNSEIKNIQFQVVCDVKNPLYGENGAAYIYGHQKGANKLEIELLDAGLRNYSKQILGFLNKEVAFMEGAGAAGGMGAGAVAFLDAKIVSGIEFILQKTNFYNLFDQKVDLIFTGEGSLDKQTVEGKVIKGISEVSKKVNIPFSIISGVVNDEELILDKLKPFSIKSILGLNVYKEEAMNNASKYVTDLTIETLKLFNKR